MRNRLARPKGTPKTGGRQKGTPNKATVEAKAICSSIVDDPKYLQSLRRRAHTGKLAPAVECLLWHYAKGKPKEIIAHEGGEIPLSFTLNLDRHER